jgi:signal transduction histidine kinase
MTQQLRSDTADQALAALLHVTDATNVARNPRSIAQAGLDRTLAVTAMTSGSVWLREGDDIVCLACRPQPAPATPDVAVLRVIESGRAEYVDDRGRANSSADVLPLVARGERIGALALAGAPSQPARDLLEAIAGALAGAIQQARLAEQAAALGPQLQAIQRQQNELVAIISHDLKNPMASIKGYADLLLRRSARNPDDPNRRGLQIISEQIVRMSGLLDKLLDISRISNQRLRIERRPADLAQIVARLVADLQAATGRQNLALEGVERACPGAFDVGRIRQAIENVVANAIAYSPNSSPIMVQLECSQQEAVVAVADRGLGIPAHEHDRVFEPFFRASNAAGCSGMGMGLFVTQQILARHDGRIWFESAEGQGSTFYIALPVSS